MRAKQCKARKRARVWRHRHEGFTTAQMATLQVNTRMVCIPYPVDAVQEANEVGEKRGNEEPAAWASVGSVLAHDMEHAIAWR